MKCNRNGPCWCGSGRKYKHCHQPIEEKIANYARQGYETPPLTLLKTPEQIEGLRRSAQVNTALLDYLTPYVEPGVTTGELDRLAERFTREHGAVPAPLHYNGFPKSICTSVNNQVCHGIPSDQVMLREGDIVNVDVSTILDGYFSDASRMFTLGEITPEAAKLVRVAKECMEAGVRALAPWGTLGDMGEAVHTHARQNGYSVVKEIGGHGIGLAFHEEPYVSYVSRQGTDMLLAPGFVFTVEPMVNQGSDGVVTDPANGWEVTTKDGGLSAQWESMVLITETGVEVLSR